MASCRSGPKLNVPFLHLPGVTKENIWENLSEDVTEPATTRILSQHSTNEPRPLDVSVLFSSHLRHTSFYLNLFCGFLHLWLRPGKILCFSELSNYI